MTFADRLAARARDVGSHLCVGIDPRRERLPVEFAQHEDFPAALVQYGRRLIDLTHEHALAFKLQSAFFELHGPEAWASYFTIAKYARETGALVIADAKRGDIGSTAEAYAQAGFGSFQNKDQPPFDALTVNPFFGKDGLAPFFRYAAERERGVIVLVKTSNPSSSELQDLTLQDGQRVHEDLSNRMNLWSGEFPGTVAAVIGATHPEVARKLRKLMPKTWFLMPGVGAQGATAQDAAEGADAEGSRIMVSLSRALSEPWGEACPPTNWQEQIRVATVSWAQQVEQALAGEPA